ncbi:UBN2_3 domain-containing protein [Quillaja saponaria]|uniref:UBN2_3 domain-containing protein n=1 Tax=Quillaja saponaria TaxID=32244 RepID=A0AAD7P5F0_QUISA|nr:UBN2_3 domain-containing protein [Quillaja saponaria]
MAQPDESKLVSNSSSEQVSIQITTMKLNGGKYLMWTKAMHFALVARKKLKYILYDPLASDSKDLEEWETKNCIVISWSSNSMEPTIHVNVMYLDTAKDLGHCS